ncbi:MiaB/RimO family radical SAM methylthiotransferase [Chloroflexota bacterium]
MSILPKYYIWTIGCQMNKAESERFGGALTQAGYEVAEKLVEANLIILNTCVVRQGAEDRATGRIHSFKKLKSQNPSLKIAVTGCLVGEDIPALQKRFPHVDYFFGAGAPLPFLDEPTAATVGQVAPSEYLPIMQGCNNFCTYCIVPYRRGRERSRPPDEIVAEAESLMEGGAREIILLGQNVNSYGHDLPEKPSLAALLARLNNIGKLARIRFLTNHPKDMSQELIEAIAGLVKVCEHVNLPVQAGSDKILKTMGRNYTADHYRSLVKALRQTVPGIAISTDIIVGFPGETPEDFIDTFTLLRELRLDMVHTAPYSTRPGTAAAAKLTDDVPEAEKTARFEKIEKLQEEIAQDTNRALENTVTEILVEGRKKGKWWGRTRTDKLVFVRAEANLLGKLIRVKIEKSAPWSLQSSLIEKIY